MRKTKKMILASLMMMTFILLSISCSDSFLDRKPQGSYGVEAVINPTGIEGVLVGAYGSLDGVPVQGAEWQGAISNWVFGGIPSDDAYKGTDGGDQPEQTSIERFVWLTTNNHVHGKWGALYNGIARANLVLKLLPSVTGLLPERSIQIVAEAKFLRGLYYFEAKKMWKNIPYIDEVQYDPVNPESVKVTNTVDVWPKIEADFQAAMADLPATQSLPGRPTKYAAIAMLAKCNMYQAFDVYTGAPNIAKITTAKGLLDQIINSGNYILEPNFFSNFSAGSRNNKESIFEVQYSLVSAADGGGNKGDALAWPYNNGPGGCCGFYQPSQNLVNSYRTDVNGLPLLDTFNDTDVANDATPTSIPSNQPFVAETGNLDSRIDHTLGRRGIPYLDWGLHKGKDWVRDQAYGGPYNPKKHNAEKKFSGVAGWQNLNANNYRMIRYSHILLWSAECEAELGNLDVATDRVNMVRERSSKPESFVKKYVDDADPSKGFSTTPAANYVVGLYTTDFSDLTFARKAIRFEEKLEFAMEGTRFFELVRWGIAEQTLNAYILKEKVKRTYLSGAAFVKHKNEYYPIPQAEIVSSSKSGVPTLTQNEGY